MRHADVRRRIIVCATAALVLLAADQAIRHDVLDVHAYDLDTFARKEAAWKGLPDGSIALLGSSRVMFALVPDEFSEATGRRAYNLGISATKPAEWLELTREMFAGATPELVVLGINAGELGADYQPSVAARHLFEYSDCLEHCRRFGWSPEVVRTYLRYSLESAYQVLDSRYEIQLWIQEKLDPILPAHASQARERRSRVMDYEVPDGFFHPWLLGRNLRNLEERMAANEPDLVAWSVPPFRANSPSFTYLDELLVSLRQKGCSVLVAYLPNSPRTEDRWRQVEPLFQREIERHCRQASVPFVCLDHETLPRENRDFVDEVHMGLDLARRLSQRIARQVVADRLIEPHKPAWAHAGRKGRHP